MNRPNVALLRQTMAHIEANLDRWHQGEYRIDLAVIDPECCGTAFCFAGWSAELSGAKWAHAANDLQKNDLIETPDFYITAELYAAELLGIEYTRTGEGDIPLFDPDNTLDDLRRIVDELCAGAGQ